MLDEYRWTIAGGLAIATFVLTFVLMLQQSNHQPTPPTHDAPADRQPLAQNNHPTPAGRKINWFGWTKRRWFWWPVLALAATIAVFFAWQHLPPTSFPTVGAWGNSGNQSDVISWWDWFFQSTETGIPGIPRWLLAVAGLLVAALLLLGKSPSANKAKHD
jgi:hypothetical protein